MKKEFWQQHIDAFNKTNLSNIAYANKQGLAYSQFLYWRQKLSVEPKGVKTPVPSKVQAPFASVTVKPPKATVTSTTPCKPLGVLEFPNGTKLLIHDILLLTELPKLCLPRPYSMLPSHSKIWFYRQPIDFRKQIDGLVLLVDGNLGKDPTSGQLFIFRNKKADKLKMLYWEDDGFWMFYKRRESSRHKFPAKLDVTVELSSQQLQWLLSGLDFSLKKEEKRDEITHFF